LKNNIPAPSAHRVTYGFSSLAIKSTSQYRPMQPADQKASAQKCESRDEGWAAGSPGSIGIAIVPKLRREGNRTPDATPAHELEQDWRQEHLKRSRFLTHHATSKWGKTDVRVRDRTGLLCVDLSRRPASWRRGWPRVMSGIIVDVNRDSACLQYLFVTCFLKLGSMRKRMKIRSRVYFGVNPFKPK
jgi:hypothetical protein